MDICLYECNYFIIHCLGLIDTLAIINLWIDENQVLK